MFKGDRRPPPPPPEEFQKILEIEGYDGLVLDDDENRDIFQLFVHAKGAFQCHFQQVSGAPDACALN